MSAAEELPQELWVQILQHVPNSQRLGTCALVCRKLARAAAAATTSVEVHSFNRPAHHNSFFSWTTSHGSLLTRLYLSGYGSCIRQLPCPNLVELELHYYSGHVQLCAGSADLGLLHSCPALTKLAVSYCALMDGLVDAPVGQMPSAPAQLQHLSWDTVEPTDGKPTDGELVQAVQERLLPQLTALTHLMLDFSNVNYVPKLHSCFLQHISTLVRLQEMHLRDPDTISASTLPGIECLTALQDLTLSRLARRCRLEPGSLLGMATGLTRLHLEYVSLEPSQLLQLLARLTALQELELHEITNTCPQLSLYSALTASSSLQVLSARSFHAEDGVWAHVFPDGRQLPRLHTFVAHGWIDDVFPACEEDRKPYTLSSADIAHLVSCASSLKQLHVATRAGASLAPLRSLTALTSLQVAAAVSPAAVRSDLAALTQLQQLEMAVLVPDQGWDEPQGPDPFLPLTALQQLTRLVSARVMGEVQDGTMRWHLNKLTLDSKAPAGAAPDVWLQLLARCATSPASHPAVMGVMLQQLQLQREQVAELQLQHRQELAAARAQAAAAATHAMSEARAEAAELRGRVQALERQQEQAAAARAEAATATAEAAELRGRIQALEGQLQEVLAALKQQRLA